MIYVNDCSIRVVRSFIKIFVQKVFGQVWLICTFVVLLDPLKIFQNLLVQMSDIIFTAN